jgi:hypothetical protein
MVRAGLRIQNAVAVKTWQVKNPAVGDEDGKLQ